MTFNVFIREKYVLVHTEYDFFRWKIFHELSMIINLLSLKSLILLHISIFENLLVHRILKSF